MGRRSLSTRRRKVDVQKVVFILMAQDMDRAIAFYRDVIGLELRLHEGSWAELGSDDAVVALHAGGAASSDAPAWGSSSPTSQRRAKR